VKQERIAFPPGSRKRWPRSMTEHVAPLSTSFATRPWPAILPIRSAEALADYLLALQYGLAVMARDGNEA